MFFRREGSGCKLTERAEMMFDICQEIPKVDGSRALMTVDSDMAFSYHEIT